MVIVKNAASLSEMKTIRYLVNKKAKFDTVNSPLVSYTYTLTKFTDRTEIRG